MSAAGWLSLAGAAVCLALLATGKSRPERVLTATVAVFVLLGVVTPARAVAGLSNLGLATIALLYPLAGALRRSGLLRRVTEVGFGTPSSLWLARLRIIAPVATLSAFLNNTPVVAMLLPEVGDWARRRGFAASKLLIPLSYTAILGGTCTLIGSSTNLVIAGLLVESGYPQLGIFELSPVGLGVALGGSALLVIFGGWLLPERSSKLSAAADRRSFTASFRVLPGGILEGRRLASIRVPGLDAFTPVAIQRLGEVIAAPRADQVLVGGDVVVVTASVGEVLQIDAFPGLERISGAIDDANRELVELVISHRCPLVGRGVGDGSFRELYGAAVIAVSRHGERVSPEEGTWSLQAGDVVLVEASAAFLVRAPASAHFYLVTRKPQRRPHVQRSGWQSAAVLIGVVVAAGTGFASMFQAALAGVAVLLAMRVMRWEDLLEDTDWRLLGTIAAAFGLGAAVEDSGAAGAIAGLLTELGGGSPIATLCVLFAATVLITELVTNNAAAVLMLPIALGAATDLGLPHLPFVAVTMMAASASFLTPIGYQTNLMVYGPGGYRFHDFARAGAPLTLCTGVATIVISSYLWL